MKFIKKRKILFIILSIILVCSFIIGAGTVYLCDYYPADEGAVAVFSNDENIVIFTDKDENVIFKPQNASCGIIFYPGGKVEHNAYQPLMAELARKGFFCVIVKMPFNLAVFDINAANGIQSQYPEIKNWYMGGHSLGGSMASSYISKHIEEYKGLILLASYSTTDISKSNLDVLSIYGSEDRVLNIEKYNKNKSNLPSDVAEVIIEGGCHAYFGMYGAQDGDGEPTISNTEQIDITVENIVKMINGES